MQEHRSSTNTDDSTEFEMPIFSVFLKIKYLSQWTYKLKGFGKSLPGLFDSWRNFLFTKVKISFVTTYMYIKKPYTCSTYHSFQG